jgi:hypothetical protein
MPRPSVEIDTSGINRILRALPGNRDRVVRAIAFDIQLRAQNVAPVDTGALKNSIYTRTANNEPLPDVSGYNPDAGRVELPAVTEPGVAHIGPSVDYGAPVELGMDGRAARPYLGPAVTAVRGFLERYRAEFERMAEGR